MPRRPIRRAPRSSVADDRNGSPIEMLEARLLLATQTFSNPLPMNLFEDFNPPTPAFRYPGFVNVSGVNGPITELRVTLFGVYHDRPEDMDVLVVSPSGRSVIVMSDAGSSFPLAGDNPIDLTFTDSATRDLPETSRINAGVYRPTNYDQDDFFPDPAPFDAPTDTDLMALAGEDPNGTWLLYLVDDTVGNTGGIGFGWGLTFVTGSSGPPAPSTPDLHPSSDRGASNTDNITNVTTPVFRGTAAAGSTQVRLFVDGVANATGAVTNGNYQMPVNGALTDGTHAISARALDAQGNEGAVSGDLLVTIDTVLPGTPSAPDLTPDSDTGASNTDNDTSDTTPTFTGTTLGANTVQLLADNLPVGTANVTDGTYTVTSSALANGTHQFTVLATDLAGNNSSVSLPLTVIIRPGTVVTPKITEVFARGSTWAPPDGDALNLTFMEYLKAHAQGDDVYGYKLAPGASLPWVNVNQLILRYDAPLSAVPAAAGIVVHGLRSDYPVTTLLVNTQTVLLALPRVLGNLPDGTDNGDRISLTVPGAAAGGAAYTLSFLVLQGDVDKNGIVSAQDFSDVKKKFFKTTNDPAPGTAADYSPFHDVNADGTILANDYSEVKKRFFDDVPAAAAAPQTFSATRVADDVLA